MAEGRGGLAVALVQRIQDDGRVQPIAQWLFAPMIDDRTAAGASLGTPGHSVWNSYLLGVAGTDRVPPCCSP